MSNIIWADKVDGSSTVNAADMNNIKTAVNSKVDTVGGKQLSTEDYTTSEKTKLAGITTGATVNSPDSVLLNRANHIGTQAVSTITGLASQLSLLAPLVDAVLTGNPTAPTQATGNNTTRLATTAFVQQEILSNGFYADTLYFSGSGSSGSPLSLVNNGVTYAIMQNVSATSRLLGRITTGAGIIEELTGTQATSLLDVFTTGAKGLVPIASGGSTTTQFLRKDGTWATPSGGGSGLLAGGTGVTITTGGFDIDFSTYAGSYREIRIKIYRLSTTTASNQIHLRVSADGITFPTTAGSYLKAFSYGGGGANDIGADKITILDGFGTTAGRKTNGFIRILNPSDATSRPAIMFDFAHPNGDSSGIQRVSGSGVYNGAEQVTHAIRLLTEAGTATFDYEIWGE